MPGQNLKDTKPFSNFKAFALIDDWLTSELIDRNHQFTTKKIFPQYAGYPYLAEGVSASHIEASIFQICESYNKPSAIRHRVLNQIILNLIANPNLRSWRRIKIQNYLDKVLSNTLPRNSLVSDFSVRRNFAIPLTNWQLYLLIRQMSFYMVLLCPLSSIELRQTTFLGPEVQATIFCHKKSIKLGELIPDLIGTTVTMTNADLEEVDQFNTESGYSNWDFSVLLSNLNGGKFQVLLGPARFVNHSCLPNVKVRTHAN